MPKNELALITGATSGIGAVYARKLAERNCDLILIGRREEKLNSLAQELMNVHNVKVETIIAELSDDADLEILTDKIKNLPDLSILINNAGFGLRANFIDGDIKVYENMVKAHAIATMKFTHAALQNMKLKNAGTIINVSSIGAYYPFVQSSVYCATKAFISIFTETLAQELKDTEVRVQALCPGMTATEFFNRMDEDIEELSTKRKATFMSAEDVVDLSFKYLKENRVVCIPGDYNQVVVWRRFTKRLL
ncbi:MAG: SDR family oxidoreductase [Gammaproteobacteria bacterium]|jgi:short-subunit dehydrogenase